MRRWAGVGLAFAVAASLSAAGCKDDQTKTRYAKPAPGTGGAGQAGSQPPGPIPPSPVHPQENALSGTVSGKITDMSFNRLVLSDNDGHRFWLTITPKTVVTQNGQQTSALALKEGAEATVVFHTEENGGHQTITRADVTKPAAPAQP